MRITNKEVVQITLTVIYIKTKKRDKELYLFDSQIELDVFLKHFKFNVLNLNYTSNLYLYKGNIYYISKITRINENTQFDKLSMCELIQLSEYFN